MNLPKTGFGTYKLTDRKKCIDVVNDALDIGYYLLDTASYYENEKYVGEALRERDREEFAVTTKIWPVDFDPDRVKFSIERSLNDLGVDYIDIMLIHWPSEGFEKVWKILEDYKEQGIFKEIGVANFHKKHLEKLKITANIRPFLDQLETHLLLQQSEMHRYLEKEGILHQAWSPLARADKKIFKNPEVLRIAKKYNASPAQIDLAFLRKKGIYVIPKTESKKRMKENLEAENIDLSSADMEKLGALDCEYRVSHSPDDEKWLRKIRWEG